MEKEKGNTPSKVMTYCVLLGVIFILDSIMVINSPYLFVRVLNLIIIVFLSFVIGALIREMFILKNKGKHYQNYE